MWEELGPRKSGTAIGDCFAQLNVCADTNKKTRRFGAKAVL
jgi:hypothetical protein